MLLEVALVMAWAICCWNTCRSTMGRSLNLDSPFTLQLRYLLVNMYDQLASIDKSKTSWKIKVRNTHMWPSVTSRKAEDGSITEKCHGYNLILLDDYDCHIHAFVFFDIWTALPEPIVEGQCYVISSFNTKAATGKHRPVSHKMTISFTNSTYFLPVNHNVPSIPQHKFEFVDLGDLYQIATADGVSDFATDVIGVVEDYETLKVIDTKVGSREIVRFRIGDGSRSHRVTAWGPAAVDMAHQYEGNNFENPVLAVITSTRLTTWKSFRKKDTKILEM